MTTAQERAMRLASETCARIAQVAPAGMGTWPGAWQRVADADAAACAALERMAGLADAGELARATSDARGATTALVMAWRGAALAWMGAGAPGAAAA